MHFAPVTKAAGTAGNAEGSTPLNAFDNALLAAGIGNINLIKVSSILPPGVELVALPRIKPGALVPTAYAAMTSEVPGEVVAAAVGWARPVDPAKNGVIMEYHDKATREETDAYSAFSGTELADALRRRGVRRVFVGGLATDYCVLNTVRDALREGFDVVVLDDAIRAVNVNPDDGARAKQEMETRGAVLARYEEIAA